jgi:acyl transferase domain-containing protein/phosphopantetheinyl transferase
VTSEPVAVVGMSCLFPGARDLDAFWANILGKVDSVVDVPPEAWDPALYYDPDLTDPDKVYARKGGYLGALAEFDPLPHGIPPVAVGGEPDQWLALQLAQDALGDAGCLDLPDDVRARAGVVLGKGTYLNGGNAIAVQRSLVVEQTLALLQRLQPELSAPQLGRLRSELKEVLPPLGPETVAGLVPNVIVGRIANRLDFMGPTYTVDAACASSLIAVQLAVQDLRSGACDLVVAGGSQVWMPVPSLNVFCRLGALSRSERIRPFDAEADGTLLGEGIGMVVLKRLADAQRDGNRVYSVVRGVGVASDGRGAGVMAPRVEGEEMALRRAYEDAQLDPLTVGLIEAHGTATPVGDVVEVAALRRVFGGRRGELGTVALGSVKSMISHTIPAAGIAGVIKTSLALHHKVLPPTLNVTTPNPRLELGSTPFYLNTETRPWVHGGPTPRRAGVNAFGFGGINAHAVLEEAPEDQAAEHLPPWDCELFVVEGGSRAELVSRAQGLLRDLRGLDAPLVDLAATLAARLGRAPAPTRLAIVAASVDELVGKLERALGRLADPACTRIHGVSGTFFAERPLGREGRLAFLFPGEGSQYLDMLTDLCLHFPEVREAFDRADRRGAGRPGVSVAQSVFPPPQFTAVERSAAEERLMGMRTAIESVQTANDALLALTRTLGIQPSECAGHSSGEYSAALASGLLGVDDEHREGGLAVSHDAYTAAQAGGDPPTGVLFSLGAGREEAEALAREVGEGVTVAMDNCPHQTVVVAAPAAAEAFLAVAGAAGLVCERLAYDRAVHTPAFGPFAARLRRVLDAIPLGKPTARLWSCAAAAPYPEQVDDLRRLFAEQWAAPVEFRTMVERMWEAGTRVFLEVGPRGNLSAFAEDILRGKDFCAIPLDTQRRSGTRQLNLAVGMLAVHDVAVDVAALYARRAHRVDEALFDRQVPVPPRRHSPLATGWPGLVLSDDALARTGIVAAREADLTVAERGGASPHPILAEADGREPPPASAAGGLPVPGLGLGPDRAGPAAALDAHFTTMSSFLSVTEQILAAYFGDPPPDTAYPLLGTVVDEVPGQELLARRTLEPRTDPYLLDHCFGGRVSDRDPDLVGLAPVPLTVSLEILAEAGARLVPGLVVTNLRQVRANRWLASDGTPRTLETRAVRLAASDGTEQVAVSLRFADDDATEPAVEGVVVLGPSYPEPPAPLPGPAVRDSAWAGAELYGADGMFHGPSWQGVVAVGGSGPDGATATLGAPPASGRLPDGLQLDPVVLDAAGQVIGFWAAEQLSGGTVVFPVGLDELAIYAPPPAAGSRVGCATRSRLPHAEIVVSDIDVLDPSGALWMRLAGWADKRFTPPAGFDGLLRPTDVVLSSETRAPLQGLGRAADALTLRRLDVGLTTDLPFWTSVWAARIQGRAERATWAGRTGPAARRLVHLAGRAAAKDAVAALTPLGALPADIEIGSDARGRPVVRWDGPPVQVSIAHSGGTAVAVAGTGPDAERLGVDVEERGTRPESFATTAFDPHERALLADLGPEVLDEWALRLWCAKEAVAKGVGTGLLDGPGSVTVEGVDRETGQVLARLHGSLVRATPDLADTPVLVATWADDTVVVATTTCAPAPFPRPLAADREAGHEQ